MAGFGRSSSPWLYSSPGEYLGPLFHFSNTWQLVINTGTTIVTFLMVFLIQRTQNKDALSIHLKLNEIVVAMEGTSNRLVDVEDLTEDEIGVLHKHYQKLVAMAKHDAKLTDTHSISTPLCPGLFKNRLSLLFFRVFTANDRVLTNAPS